MRVFALLAFIAATALAAQDPLLNLKDAEDRRVLANADRPAWSATDCYKVDPDSKFADTNSEKFWTQCFGKVANIHDVATFEGSYQIGVILGFIVTGCAMIFAVSVIIADEFGRHKDFAAQILKDEDILLTKLGCSANDIDRYRTDFITKENAVAMSKAEEEAEREKLAEIN